MNKDNIYMARAIELAKKGNGYVSTNPMVGAVIVYQDKIIGEGYHQKYGENHAEINALNTVKASDKDKLPLSTMYVSLEPCSHWGKTPPCCEQIVKQKIKKVVIAMKDPFSKVCGRGIDMMRANNIEVKVGIMENEAKELNKRFITFHEKKRPYIILKWAATIDQFIDSERNTSKPAPWITNYACKILVHKWRAEEDAIWVGKNTVIRDNPTLNIREWFGNNPLRISMDNKSEINQTYNINNKDAETIIFNQHSIEQIIEELYKKNIQSIFVEGGKYLLDYLIEHKIFDEIREFISPLTINQISNKATQGIKSPQIKHAIKTNSEKIGNITLNTYKKQPTIK